jgi:hypothetical protein
MKKVIAPLAALALCSFIWTGCASKTPKAEVPPPPPPPAKAYQQPVSETQPWSDKDHVRTQSPSARATLAQETITRFQTAYPAAGSPTIVLFINQQPDADMRATQTGGLDSSDKSALWAVENGFLQPFIKAGSTIKHGAMAIRRTEPEPEKSGDPSETPAAPSPKPDPLHGRADLVITLNVTPLPQAENGYAVKAMAREVESGVIVGHAAGSSQMTGKKAVPTKQGYQFKEAGPQDLPLDFVARGVAVDLMNSLMEKWAAAPPAVEPENETGTRQ